MMRKNGSWLRLQLAAVMKQACLHTHTHTHVLENTHACNMRAPTFAAARPQGCLGKGPFCVHPQTTPAAGHGSTQSAGGKNEEWERLPSARSWDEVHFREGAQFGSSQSMRGLLGMGEAVTCQITG
eukprot:1153806-Pelagomonas_calceolata.AAC.10